MAAENYKSTVTYCGVSCPDIRGMTSIFGKFPFRFNTEEQEEFTTRFNEINAKVKEHRRIVKELQIQADNYIRADSEKAKYQFRLDIAINAYRTQNNCLLKLINQRRVNNVKAKLNKKIQTATVTTEIYTSILGKEVSSRMEIQLLSHTLYVDVLCALQKKELQSNPNMPNCPSESQVSAEKILEKYKRHQLLVVPKDLTRQCKKEN